MSLIFVIPRSDWEWRVGSAAFSTELFLRNARLRTDGGLEGRSLIFTVGDGTQIQTAAVEALRRFVVGRKLEEFIAEPGLFAQALTEHHQLRWLALGAYRMAVGGVINALWDLWAKSEGLPMWRLLTSAAGANCPVY